MVQEIVESPALLHGRADHSVRPRIPRIHSRIGRFKWSSRVAEAARSGPLAVKNFRLLSVGQSTSTVGDYCYAVALPWLILSGHGGTVMLGAVLACYGIPRTLLIPIGGALADRLGPRKLMLVADTSRFVLMGLLAVLAARPADALAVIVPIALLLGACEGMFLPASLSIMPTLLPAGQLPTGNALASATIQIGSLAGPVLGGLLVAPAGPCPAFAVDAASFGISAIALALIRVKPAAQAPAAAVAKAPERAAQPEASAAAAEPGPGSWQLLREFSVLRIILAVAVVANLTAAGTFDVALPALAHARYGASGLGGLIACFGAGSLIGTLAGARMGSLRRPFAVACRGFVIEAVLLSALPLLGGLPGAVTAILLAGLCNGFGNIVLFTLIQQNAPSQSLGRVMSLLTLAAMGTYPISVWLSGLLIKHLDAVSFFPIAGITLGLAVLAALSQREMREFGAASST
ncbi:MAG TPA: MFS transporter [Streptosporangiaceae bacterium]|nr:MFS transporter [Streptosporangiaceae bacterium]